MVNAWIPAKIFWTYRWWKKSCTTWHLWNPVTNGIFINWCRISSTNRFHTTIRWGDGPETAVSLALGEPDAALVAAAWRKQLEVAIEERRGTPFWNKTEEKTNGGKPKPIEFELFSSWWAWFDGLVRWFLHSHDNLKHRNSRSWLGNLFQVSSAAIRSQIELVAFEPAWLIPAFFLTWWLLPKLLCLGNLCCQKLLPSLKPSTVSRTYLYCASTCTIYLPMFNSNSNPGSGISTCQDLEEIFFRSDMQGIRLKSGILRKAQKLGQSIEFLILCWRVWVSTLNLGGGGRYSISFFNWRSSQLRANDQRMSDRMRLCALS